MNNPSTAAKPARNKSSHESLEVLSVRHWTDRLFSFRTTRPESLRFRSGEFLMIGLHDETGKAIMRAYSIASPNWDEELEFYSIKVPDGPLTSRLCKIEPGDSVLLRPKPVGTLVYDALVSGKRLWLFATGTGIAPFASIIRDPETYEHFEQVILTHTCRQAAELDYGKDLMQRIADDELISEFVGDRLTYYPSTTREASEHQGRITSLIESGKLFEDLGLEGLKPDEDRAMLCGSLAFNRDMMQVLEARGLEQGSNSKPGHYVVEKAFVD
ncbi:MAG: ferredoxin--NADP(+) reductase [Gammaproteobacteria bacterium]|nr:MAG: ferredoxin--NADP(+) reductase [Gammaproteobacteria bacterium]